jgi:hypothetical protein
MQDEIRHGTAVCLRHGEEAAASKLSSEDVRKIRELYTEGHSQREIASAFSISQRHVSDIVRYKTRRFDGFPGGVGPPRSLWPDAPETAAPLRVQISRFKRGINP